MGEKILSAQNLKNYQKRIFTTDAHLIKTKLKEVILIKKFIKIIAILLTLVFISSHGNMIKVVEGAINIFRAIIGFLSIVLTMPFKLVLEIIDIILN